MASQFIPVAVIAPDRVSVTATFALGSPTTLSLRWMATLILSGTLLTGVTNTVGVALYALGKVTTAVVGVSAALGVIFTPPHCTSRPPSSA